MSDTSLRVAPSRLAAVLPILIGVLLALIGASLYMFYQLGLMRDALQQVREDQSQTRQQLMAEIARVNEASALQSATTTQNNQNTVDTLKAALDAARRQAGKLVGDAQTSANKQVAELAGKLEKAQQEQAQRVSQVSEAVSQVKTDAEATKSKVGEVSNEVGTVKADLSTAKSELEHGLQDLKRVQGDLGMQSGLIATNAKELATLRAAGERNYVEFTLAKKENMRRIGDLQIRLKSSDPQKSRYTIEVMADDKKVEKKDKTLNEPVQFKLLRSDQPFEVVVNEIKKDLITGYLAAPKIQQTRN